MLDSLRRQRQRTGDDGFDIDISQKEDEIKNLRRQVERAQEIAHEWEGQAGIIELQLIANDCGSFA